MHGALTNASNIVSCDGLPIDVLYNFKTQAAFETVVEGNNLDADGKTPVAGEGSRRLAEQIERMTARGECDFIGAEPGGSSANTLSTLNKLLGKILTIRFLGVPGAGAHGDAIRRSLKDAGIDVVEPSSSLVPKTAVTYVLNAPEGQCARVTDRGDFKKVITKDLITDTWVADADVVFVQGSLFAKLSPDIPGRLIDKTREHKKILVLTVPTDKNLDAAQAERFRQIIPQADILFGNIDELARVYPDTDPAKALQRLKGDFEATARRGRPQVSFITCGQEGACVVTAGDELLRVPGLKLHRSMGSVGAGDTASAGWWAGQYRGLDYRASAEIGIVLAVRKMEEASGPRLPDPMATLWARSRALAGMLCGEFESARPDEVGVKESWSHGGAQLLESKR